MAIRKMHPFLFLCDAMQCTSYHVWDRSHETVSIQLLLFVAASVIVLSCAKKKGLCIYNTAYFWMVFIGAIVSTHDFFS